MTPEPVVLKLTMPKRSTAGAIAAVSWAEIGPMMALNFSSSPKRWPCVAACAGSLTVSSCSISTWRPSTPPASLT
jgi:hypothetical protein